MSAKTVRGGGERRTGTVSYWSLQKYRRYFEQARLRWFGLYDGFLLRHRYHSWTIYQSGCPWPGPRMLKTYHWLYPPALVWYCFSTPPGPSGRVSSVLVWSEIILVMDPSYDFYQKIFNQGSMDDFPHRSLCKVQTRVRLILKLSRVISVKRSTDHQRSEDTRFSYLNQFLDQ